MNTFAIIGMIVVWAWLILACVFINTIITDGLYSEQHVPNWFGYMVIIEFMLITVAYLFYIINNF